ncbi:hypothetical protein ANN_21646 [Periplaneta americana]|uniref:Uncharacterized protein n=1 Tax=Periplaneta americana TaxID=6978 RepID=A0ABQ8S611_PERAM|nr:hypothetical protein ANN_21646 [Periplaneta americana]
MAGLCEGGNEPAGSLKGRPMYTTLQVLLHYIKLKVSKHYTESVWFNILEDRAAEGDTTRPQERKIWQECISGLAGSWRRQGDYEEEKMKILEEIMKEKWEIYAREKMKKLEEIMKEKIE